MYLKLKFSVTWSPFWSGLLSYSEVNNLLGPIQPFIVQNQLRPASQTQPPSFRLHSAAWMSSFFAGRTASVYAGNNEIQFLSKHTLRLRCKPVLSRVSDWLQIDAHSFRSLNHFFLLFAVNLAAPLIKKSSYNYSQVLFKWNSLGDYSVKLFISTLENTNSLLFRKTSN